MLKRFFRQANRLLILLAVSSAALFSCMAQINKTVVAVDTPTTSFDIASDTPQVTPSTAPPVSADICIPPIDDFVYLNSPDPAKPVPGKDLIVTPPPPWEMVSLLPEDAGRFYQFSRAIDDHVEVWIESPSGNWNNNPDIAFRAFSFLVYRTDTKEWKKVSAMISGSTVAVGKLFTAKDGALWGASGSDFIFPSTDWKSPLAKYNEETEKFEFVEEASHIPAGRTNPKEIYERPFWSITLQDASGVFWILAHKDAIYWFDPMTYQSEKYADIPTTIVAQAAISPNGEIYYLLGGIDSFYIHSIRDWPFFRFNTKNNKTERIGIDLEPWPNFFTNMLVDHEGRLWLDGLGFREPDGKWYQIHKPSVFVTNISLNSIDYRWKRPTILMESSDGRLWFDSPNGTTWFDLDKRKWCWFTTYRSNIVEDSEHSLWMIANGKLYQLPLGEK